MPFRTSAIQNGSEWRYEEMKLVPEQIAAKVGKPLPYVLDIIRELQEGKEN